MGARPRVLRAEPRAHDCIGLASSLFPEALERGGRGWRSLAAFLLSSPTALWAGGVQRVWDQGEKQRALGLHIISPSPSPTSSLRARPRGGPLAALSFMSRSAVRSAVRGVLGDSESRAARGLVGPFPLRCLFF